VGTYRTDPGTKRARSPKGNAPGRREKKGCIHEIGKRKSVLEKKKGAPVPRKRRVKEPTFYPRGSSPRRDEGFVYP